ncbi:uncharacterized protein BO95DRAFT_13599 [Aspergillus brunneoviolaceus CBS 621.78]|uniref:Uncharacterized protein n=1 Tax=Aspergillus brunneoviolaceus CBS 621.78 TaxID=1450534 RepID=A0ACD1GJ77_9EURO|nr:hypothetical protein BO95DRAFT_13599 [Aspergillus brunneoviolaceus CBS 621.78]RAH49295.1 hypothetical protein BO95DRAFT_13599 [Aspergillus brunneoviolaceus CBS 621.78]
MATPFDALAMAIAHKDWPRELRVSSCGKINVPHPATTSGETIGCGSAITWHWYYQEAKSLRGKEIIYGSGESAAQRLREAMGPGHNMSWNQEPSPSWNALSPRYKDAYSSIETIEKRKRENGCSFIPGVNESSKIGRRSGRSVRTRKNGTRRLTSTRLSQATT